MLRCLLLGALSLSLPLFVTAADQSTNKKAQQNSGANRTSPLVEKVRQATAQFRDINVAIGDGWVPATPCVSGPNTGAMGVHFVLPARVGDGTIVADEPEAL